MPSSLPSDPADLFAELYDRLPRRSFAGDDAHRWYEDRDLAARAFEIRDGVLATGRASPGLLAEIEGGDHPFTFTVARGLDAALEYLNPYSGHYDPVRLYEIGRRYAATGRLNSKANGALLPRCSFPGRPPGVPDKADFFGLVRVPQAIWETVDHARIENESDLTLEHFNRRASTIGVGCAPLIGSYEEMRFEKTRRAIRLGYRIHPGAGAIRSRPRAVLAALDVQGAVIGVAPEASLSAELLGEWIEALRAPGRDGSRLEWLLAGTGPIGDLEPPVNRAILVDRGGRPLIEQDKLRDFTLTIRQLRTWRLTERLGTLPRVEDITRGERLQIRESNLGRVAILICEDLTQSDIATAIAACGVSHIFVPIFSPPVRDISTDPPEDSWVIHSAIKHANDVGAWLIVATSLAVGRAMFPGASHLVTSAAIGPREDRDDWVPEIRYGEAARADDVCIFQVPPGLARRFTDFR